MKKGNENIEDKFISYFSSLEKEVPEDKINMQWEKIKEQYKNNKRSKHIPLYNLYKYIAYAAIFIGVILSVTFYHQKDTIVSDIEHSISMLDNIPVDSTQKILLFTQKQEPIILNNNSKISYSSKGEVAINSKKVNKQSTKTKYNSLIVPKGQSSHLVLADGTSLHINAGTKLLYPNVFTGDKREIYVDGEIYINVKKNPNKPFIVKTSKFDICVTGTSFNVNAYKEINEAEVALINGSITIRDCNNNETKVKPNELLTLTDGVTTSLQNVDASDYITWTKGLFNLQNRSFEDILQRLSIYYGCEITYEPRVKDLSLEGTIDMNTTLPQILEYISKIHPIEISKTKQGYYLSIK